MSRPPDDDAWQHRHVSANGARFHVAECGRGPLVLLLHGFPEFWWAWRHQLPALADAGYRAAAMDLRGYGDSDKTPRGYDPLTLAADVAGVIRTLGSRRAVLVGHGWGGYVAWTVATAFPGCVEALAVVGAPHPTELFAAPLRLIRRGPVAHVVAMQLPWLPERRIRRREYLARHFGAWAAPGSSFPTHEEVERYRAALELWPAPHCALEYHRWLFRSRGRSDGRAFAAMMRRPITAGIPVLQLTGRDDPAVQPAAVKASAAHVSGPYDEVWLSDTGHFAHEERPTDVNRALLGWLSQRTGPGVGLGG